MSDWLVVVNPTAGRKPTPSSFIADALRAAGVSGEIVVPGSVGQTRRVIEQAITDGRPRVAVSGGDGTFNLAINSLMGVAAESRPILGILPGGTGCDLLKTFALPQDIPGAARHLAGEDTYDIDIVTLDGDWGRRYFANVAQAGVGAAAAETAPKMSRRLGVARYPAAFGVRLPRFPKTRVKITTERRTYESDALAVLLANAQFFAGGWNVAPRATLMDGVLDIQVINAKKTQAPALVPKVIKGTHLADPAVRRFTASEFSIETEHSWPIEADGDWLGNTPVRGRVVPGAIRLKI
ncbi:MAG: YegS/Rv2252/BmrU family lipid kinase [Acidimicrobiia bacterium]|nr:YegS/Rv2252/BmrU family lipid kinase [Acidimicrobiia bacterium]